MDGFALAAGDVAAQYRIAETIAAGAAAGRAVGRGECARIMTGAMLPPGADRVIRKEYVEEKQGIIRPHTPEPGDNVIRKGSSLRAGQTGAWAESARAPGHRHAGRFGNRRDCRGSASCHAHHLHGRRDMRSGRDARARDRSTTATVPSSAPSLPPCAAQCGPYEMVQDAPELSPRRCARRSPPATWCFSPGGVSAGDFDYVPGVSRTWARRSFSTAWP